MTEQKTSEDCFVRYARKLLLRLQKAKFKPSSFFSQIGGFRYPRRNFQTPSDKMFRTRVILKFCVICLCRDRVFELFGCSKVESFIRERTPRILHLPAIYRCEANENLFLLFSYSGLVISARHETMDTNYIFTGLRTP